MEEFPLGFGWGRFVPYKLYLVCREMCANWGVAAPVHFLCIYIFLVEPFCMVPRSVHLWRSEWLLVLHFQACSGFIPSFLQILEYLQHAAMLWNVKLIPQKDHGFAPELFNMNISWTVKDGLLLSLYSKLATCCMVEDVFNLSHTVISMSFLRLRCHTPYDELSW